MSRQGEGAMTLSSNNIPFPLGRVEGPMLTSDKDGESSSIQGRSREASAAARTHSTSFTEDRRHLHDESYEDKTDQSLRQMHLSNASSNPTASTSQKESLPSIRNLLHSIGQGDSSSDSSVSTLRRSPSAPNSGKYANASYLGAKSSHATSSSEGKQSAWEAAASSAYAKELQETMRSSSPQRRPPIAPSAFAHSQYQDQSASHLSNVHYRNEVGSSTLNGPAHPFRSIPSFNRGIVRSDSQNKKQRNLHSHSYSIPSITSEGLSDVSLPSMDRHGRGGEEEYTPLKRQSPPFTDKVTRERADRSPATSRRRHTVGALEEPIHLHESGHGYHLEQQEQSRSSATDNATPKNQQQQYTKYNVPEGKDRHSSSRRKEGHSRGDSGSRTSIKPMHRLYMQYTDTGTGSLPSLISSTSTASLVSERNRVPFVEETKEKQGVHLGGGWGMPAHPPSQFYAMGKPPSLNAMDAITSPKSRTLHSRSSTMESVETNASLNSIHYQHSRPLPPPRSSSLRFEEDNSLPWPITPTRRSREAHATTNRGNDRASVERRKYESLREGVTYPYDNSLTAASRRSSVDAVNGYGRPRAQTMTYTDRPIAPLPSHSQSSSYLYSTSDSPYSSRAGRSNSSLSVSSVGSLPQRVSSMEIDSGLRRYQDNLSNSSISSEIHNVQDAGNSSMIPSQSRFSANASNGMVASASGTAKYECGWCGKRFSRPSSLKIHHHSHTGEKPFACPAPNCGRTFSVQSNLRRHQKCHSIAVTGSGLKTEASDVQSSSLSTATAPFQQHQAYPSHQISQQPRYLSSSVAMKAPSMMSSSDRLTPQQSATIEAASRMAPFMQSRERRPSLQSSTAEDEEEEMEEGQEEQLTGSLMRQGDIGLIDEEEDKSMQDIQEEVETVHGSSSHQHQMSGNQDGHVRPALHGLLNPAMTT